MSVCAMFTIDIDQGIIFVIQHNVKLLKAEYYFFT
jgi:hypothetical protein